MAKELLISDKKALGVDCIVQLTSLATGMVFTAAP
jgi:hypothetical protein